MTSSWAETIDAPGAGARLSRSGLGSDGVVDQSPDTLLAQAHRVAGHSVTLDVYSLARVISSELGSGSPEELLCIGDADLNRARRAGLSVLDHVTGRTGRYGRQRSPRPVSTARDPYVRQLRAAQALVMGGARGIALDAVMYFDPKSQRALWLQGKAVHPLVVLERWIYDLPWAKRSRDDEGRMTATLDHDSPGGQQMRWVGAIAGVDAWELMLFARTSDKRAQRASYEAARAVIESRGTEQPAPVGADDRGLLRCAVLGAVGAVSIGMVS